MPSRAPLPATVQKILALARRDRREAAGALASRTVEEQVTLVCETPVARRAELLDLLERPELVIPELPEGELCFTAKALGLADAGWLLRHATPEQVVACVDLDAWANDVPDCAALDAWFASFADAGPETLLGAAHALDPETLVLYLKERIEVVMKTEEQGWEPPVGARTVEGQFYFRARRERDDLAEVEMLLRCLFESDYWLYFRLLQGVIWELRTETEEWALRWRSGRLEDLGFPSWNEAMGIYGYVRPEERAALPASTARLPSGRWHLPVWVPSLPVGSEARHSLFRAIARLGEQEREACFYALVALANKVAVADRLPLGEAESIPAALEKAAGEASCGLDFIAGENRIDPVEVLRRVSLERLFRVGASLDRPARAPLASKP
jgi:hypothetical protein